MRELSLFSGAGGGLLGTHLLGWRPVGYVEWNEYCQRVIAARIRDGILPAAPIFGDIHAFNRDGYAASYQGMVDVVTGGFPCQPFSLAGKRLAADDPRNGWPATIDCIRMVRPRYALLENVPGILTSGYFGTILGDLAASGFDCRWRILSAAEVGAPHKRDRLWIMAHTQRPQRRESEPRGNVTDRTSTEWQEAPSGPRTPGKNGRAADVADAESKRERSGTKEQSPNCSGGNILDRAEARGNANDDGQDDAHPQRQGLAFGERETRQRSQPAATGGSWWAVEPDVGRTLDGLARWLDFS